jgi:hypothetical protein
VDLSEIGLGGVDWIHVAQDRGQWRYFRIVSVTADICTVQPASQNVMALAKPLSAVR